MNFLVVVTPPPMIYHGCSSWKMFWEENFTLVSMKGCGRHNVRKYWEIKDGEKYIILDISFTIDYMYKREVTSLALMDYMGRSGKGLTASLTHREKR